MKIALLLLVVFSAYVVDGCRYRELECPEYQVLEEHKDYEVRRYPAITWITAKATHRYDKIAQSRAFDKLFSYISGNNNIKQKISMTVPVRYNGTDHGDTITYTMSFMVPAEFAANPPIPSDEDITVTREASTTYAVRRFPGYLWQRAAWLEEAEALKASVKDDASVEKSWFYQVGYDAPFQVFNRRNEIWMLKQDDSTNEV